MGIEEQPQPEFESPELDQNEPEQEEQEQESSESDATESAPVEGRKVEFTPEQQEVFNKAIGEKVRQQRQAERELAKAREELERVRTQLPQERRPDIPNMPDPYDDDYDKKLAAREEAIRAATAWDIRNKLIENQRLEAESRQQQAEHEQFVKTVQTYTERAKVYGITPDELQAAGSAVNAWGIDNDVAQYILADEKGPAMTIYLARNPSELDAINSMPKMQAVVYLATKVAPKVAVKTKSSAPAPADVLGTGGSPKLERGPRGVKYE